MEFLWAGVWAALAAAAINTAENYFVPRRVCRDRTVPSAPGDMPRTPLPEFGKLPRWAVFSACLWAALCGGAAAHNISAPVSMFRACVGFAVLAFIAASDYLLMIVPNKAVGVLVAGQLVAIVWEMMCGARALPLLSGSVIAALISLAVLGFLSLISKNGIGMGDVKLLGALAFLCGLRTAFFTLLLGMLLCAGAAAVFLLTRKKKLQDSIPLGPALWAGYGLSILLTLA